jgi:ParB-like chromosome segregation protein Spo0J
MTRVSLGFNLDPLSVPVDKILQSRKTPTGVTISRKYMSIRSSIQEIGLIEPLTVSPAELIDNQYILLDGHIRLIALKELGYNEVPCLVAIDDESYTYNSRIKIGRAHV